MKGFLRLKGKETGVLGLRAAIALAAALVLGLAAMVAVSLVRERESELAVVSRLAEQSASSAAESVGHDLDEVDLLLHVLTAELGHSWPDSGLPQAMFGLALSDWLSYVPKVSALQVFDAAGEGNDGVRLDPALLARHRDDALVRQLSTSPRASGGGLRLSRRIDDQGGRLLGIAVADIPSRAFEGEVAQSAAAEIVCISLVGVDGRVVAYWRRLETAGYCTDPERRSGESALARRDGGNVAISVPIRGRPLSVVVEADTGPALARWQDRAVRLAALLLLLVFGVAFASAVVSRLLRRQLETSALLRAFVDHSTTALSIRDIEGRHILVNPTYEELVGISQSDLLGRRVRELFPENIAGPSDLEFRQVIEARRPLTLDKEFETRSGKRHYILTRFPVFGPDGRAVAVGTVGTDITEIKEATAALHRTEEKFAKVFHESPDAIAIIRWDDSMIVEANEGFGRLMGRPLSELLGSRTTDFDWWADMGDRERFLETLKRAGIVRDFDFRANKPDGRQVVCVINAAVIYIDGAMHDVSITRDVTDRVTAEERVQQANIRLAEQAATLERLASDYRRQREEAETANRSKTEFLAHMSHELRTPLNAIIGFAEMIQTQLVGPVSPRYVDYSESIGRAAHHLLNVINDILDVSKIEVGRYELRRGMTDIGAIAAECCRMIVVRAEGAGVPIVNAVKHDLPTIWADARAVKQVLLNLLSNAVKFTPIDGRIDVAATVIDGYVHVTVSDTGPGISERDLKHVFEPFWQSESRTSRAREDSGTGLGLVICKKLVELHGGTIGIESRIGRGTSVTIRFPVGRESPAQSGRGTG